ncbi:hypothetical protein [Microbacterium sp. 22296]|uniref:hypothetical protein n=1 Tax=Microbacterium sp. 22296 TaxID=3453903 RepID=UPI003F86D2D6
MSVQSELLAAPQVPLRYLVRFNPRPTAMTGDESCYLPMEAISEFGAVDSTRMRRTAELAQGYSFIADGDVAYAKVTPCFENGKGLRATGLPGGYAFATTEITVMRPSRELDSMYLAWVLQSEDFREPGEAKMSGAGGLKRVPESYAASYRVPHPRVEVQRAIADYLDRETAQIDAFIAKNEELIALLTERRAATITSVLTSGLGDSPDDSDDRWFGTIPVHWDSMPLRYLLRRIEQGVSPQAEGGLAEGEGQFGVLKSGCVNGGVYRPTEHKLLPDDFDFHPSLLVRSGDLLVNRASGSIRLLGSAALVKESPYQLILSDKTFRLIPSARTTSSYLYWLLNSRIYREQVESSVSGADGLANNLPQSSLRRFVLPVPPREEQDGIDSYLTERCAQIDRSIDAARRGVELAHERRAALISAAVTGKIDVGVAT